MTSLTMDGGNRIVGTEFVKLLITGSSNLATEEYVDNVVLGGGGGGSVDAYTKSEADALLNAKLDVINPQDIIGNLRLDSTNGNSKLIINAVAPATGTDDFYCNGSGHFNGSLRVSVLTSDGDVNADGCNADTFNSHIIANDIIFKHNDVEYQRFNQSDDSLNLSKNLDMKTSTLKTNTISTNGLNDMVFNVDTLGEFLRFQVSDYTVRVPNTRSLLSQNLFTDIIKPLAISNDISLQGQNDTDDGYEEYFKVNSTTKKVDFNKPISSITCNEFNSDGNVEVVFKRNTDNFIQFKTDGRIHVNRQCFFLTTVGLDNAGSLSMVKRPESGSQIFEFSNTFSTLGKYRFKLGSNNILEMTTSLIQATRNLQCDAGIKTNTINTATNADLVIQRNGTAIFKVNSTNNGIEVADTTFLYTPRVYDYVICKTLGSDTIFQGSNSISNQAVEYFRFNYSNETVDFLKPIVAGGGIKCNTINSDGDNNVSFQRNGSTYMIFNTDKIELGKSLRAGNEIIIDSAEKLKMNPSTKGGVRIFDIKNEHPIANNPMIRFRVGDTGGSGTIITEMTNNNILFKRDVSLYTGYELQTNTINSYGNSNLVVQRNGITYFTLTDNTGVDVIDVATGKGVSTEYFYSNFIKNRFTADTIFEGAVSTEVRVEYMRWNYTAQQLDFNAPIDNTGIAITGNIIDTTVSDERLKTNIEDVECNFTECVKNVKVKTFEYTDEKYQNNDKYGFIAQELQKHLPKEFNHIVKENKDKKSDDTFLSINYMKVNLLLWGALQEEMAKTEYLESKLFETIARVEALEKQLSQSESSFGQAPKPKPKAKAKSKNVK